jgi:hypothetical protein
MKCSNDAQVLVFLRAFYVVIGVKTPIKDGVGNLI